MARDRGFHFGDNIVSAVSLVLSPPVVAYFTFLALLLTGE